MLPIDANPKYLTGPSKDTPHLLMALLNRLSPPYSKIITAEGRKFMHSEESGKFVSEFLDKLTDVLGPKIARRLMTSSGDFDQLKVAILDWAGGEESEYAKNFWGKHFGQIEETISDYELEQQNNDSHVYTYQDLPERLEGLLGKEHTELLLKKCQTTEQLRGIIEDWIGKDTWQKYFGEYNGACLDAYRTPSHYIPQEKNGAHANVSEQGLPKRLEGLLGKKHSEALLKTCKTTEQLKRVVLDWAGGEESSFAKDLWQKYFSEYNGMRLDDYSAPN